MKRALILAVGLMVPAAALANVKVSVNIGGGCNQPVYESWYEECGYQGPWQHSVEYRWEMQRGSRVLTFRTVRYHTITRAFIYGPWEISVDYCHSSCGVRHVHRYYSCERPYRREFHGKSSCKGHHKHPVCETRYYRYEPPACGPRKVYRYEAPASRGSCATQNRSPEPVRTQPPPVQRPPVRPVPGSHMSSAPASSHQSVTRSTEVRVQTQEPVRVYRPEQGSHQRSNQVASGSNGSTTITRTSERVRVW